MSQFWSTTPHIKKSLGDFESALDIFAKEIDKNLSALQEHGVFFSFSSDPCLNETFALTLNS